MDEEFSSALLTGCVLLASRCWALPRKTCRTIHPPHADQPAAEGKPRCARAPTSERSSRAPGLILVGHEVELTTAQPPPDDDGQVQTETSAGPAPPAPASRRGADSGRPRAGHGRSGRPRRPRPSQPYGCCPPPRSRTSLRPDTADAATRRHRTPTPDADTGRRTADTWTLRRPHRTLDSGPVDRQAWTLVARTGHRTPDTGHRTPDTGRWPRTWTG
jgi:hypothetical protein